ncbi:MAG: hypothetical protein O7C56_09960, partial [Rickettsia endosymbiont of Ixodes persulcatus]|nr:hypothetical protein [Rickettsia endosymbiont of Ixodes persulcatus]
MRSIPFCAHSATGNKEQAETARDGRHDTIPVFSLLYRHIAGKAALMVALPGSIDAESKQPLVGSRRWAASDEAKGLTLISPTLLYALALLFQPVL